MQLPVVPALPEIPPAVPLEFPGRGTDLPSLCTIESSGGFGVTLWSLPTARLPGSDSEVQLQLAPDSAVIIGRADGGDIDYLDPSYVPSSIMPGTGKTILQHDGRLGDRCVSRGHFMMRGHAGGILLVNGVPRRGGGIRPPLNGTLLLEPELRSLQEAEEVVIERGDLATIRLPNGTKLTIRAL